MQSEHQKKVLRPIQTQMGAKLSTEMTPELRAQQFQATVGIWNITIIENNSIIPSDDQ